MKNSLKSQTHDKSNNNLISFTKEGKIDSELLRKKSSDLKNSHKYISYQLSIPEKIQNILSSKPFLIIDMLVTLWMFYSNDFKLLYTNKNTDVYFSIITLIVMALLFIEIVSLFIIDENEYGCSLYFWIDILALGSMVFDLHFVSDRPFTNIDDCDVNIVWKAMKVAQGVLDSMYNMHDIVEEMP